jgi:hypothetical protein
MDLSKTYIQARKYLLHKKSHVLTLSYHSCSGHVAAWIHVTLFRDLEN